MPEKMGRGAGDMEDLVQTWEFYMSTVKSGYSEDHKILFLLQGLPEKYKSVLTQRESQKISGYIILFPG